MISSLFFDSVSPIKVISEGVFFTVMVLVAINDWKSMIIPNSIIGIGLIGGIVIKLFGQQGEIEAALICALSAFGFMAFIKQAGGFLFRKESMGMGDVKLAGLLGLYLGIEGFLVTLWLGTILGSIYGVLASPKRKAVIVRSEGRFAQNEIPVRLNGLDTRIPFGSFLAIASIVVMYFQNEIELWLMSSL